jgi:5-methylcytosine-specific restriction enzyme B
MEKVEEIKAFNDGTVFPIDYSSTYLATEHIQKLNLEIPEDIIDILRKKFQERDFFLDDDRILRDIAVGLINGNIILQGPPGTGKTTIAAMICEAFNVDYGIITAVTDWTTYDTIGGYQPAVNEEGEEVIVGKNGRIVESILECCNTVLNNKEYGGKNQAKWLIADELNRSEIDKVFGDLFTAFGSEDLTKRQINLWFENNKDKKSLFIPNRYRLIGVMNNIDKNFVFDLSQGLSRRFTFITINPPKYKEFENEINKVKTIVTKKLNEKLNDLDGFNVNEEYINKIYTDSEFIEHEKILCNFLKRVRYSNAAEDSVAYLGLPIGTAQIIDIYETILINLKLTDYINMKEKKDKMELLATIIDSVLTSRIVPQMDGFIYERLVSFFNGLKADKEFSVFKDTINTIANFV